MIETISKGAAQSWQMDNRWMTMAEGKFDFGFAVDWMRKDFAIILDEARRNGAQLPVAALVDQFYSEIQAMGGNRWDTSSLIARLTASSAPRHRALGRTWDVLDRRPGMRLGAYPGAITNRSAFCDPGHGAGAVPGRRGFALGLSRNRLRFGNSAPTESAAAAKAVFVSLEHLSGEVERAGDHDSHRALRQPAA